MHMYLCNVETNCCIQLLIISSISTVCLFQEEYDELLKYAVVVPDYNPNEVRSKLSDSRGVFNQEGEIITVRASTHPGLIHGKML